MKSQEIYTLLDSYNANTLWTIALHTKLPTRNKTKPKKAVLIKLMQQGLFEPARIKTSYAQLSQIEADVFNRIQLHGGQVQTRLLRRELIRAKVAKKAPPLPKRGQNSHWYQGPEAYGEAVAHVGSATSPDSIIFEDILARLTRNGLLFSRDEKVALGETNYKFQLHPGSMVFIPAIVQRHVPEPTPLLTRQAAWQPAQTRQGTPDTFLRNLYLYWDAVRRESPTVLKSGLVGKRGLKQLNSALLMPDESLKQVGREDQTERLYFWRRMTEELKLVRVADGKLAIAADSGRAIPKFWLETAVSQAKACLKAWQVIAEWGELGQDAAGAYPQYTVARKRLIQFLKKSPDDKWLEGEDILFALQGQSRNFLIGNRTEFERAQRGGWYYSSFFGNDPKSAVRKIDQYEEQFVMNAVTGFLFELGLVE